MHGVPQSPIDHAEGDVATHTQMVLKALEQLPEYRLLPPQAQEILWAAALMHDIEKRSTTVTDDDGTITAHGHAHRGAMTTRQVLYRDIPAPFCIREEIAGLVKYHGLPVRLMDKPDAVKTLLRASLEVNTEWLYLLAKADIMGRICSDSPDLLYRVELYKEMCLEQDCWGKPKQFPGSLARFRYFRKDDQDPGYVPFDDRKGDVILLSGIAGSGKDHYLAQNYPGLTVISLDSMRRRLKVDRNDTKANGRIIQEAQELAKKYLSAGKPFAWNATNITTQQRDQLIGLFAEYNPTIHIVYAEVPYARLLAQNEARDLPIPPIALERMIDRLEVPKDWEAHEVKYVVTGGDMPAAAQ